MHRKQALACPGCGFLAARFCQGACGEREFVGVVALARALFDPRKFLRELGQIRTGCYERVADVGVQHLPRCAAEAVVAAVFLVAALAVTSCEQPFARALHHGAVDGEELLHVVELEESVGGQRCVSGVAPEPLVALLAALVARDELVAPGQQCECAIRDGGNIVAAGLHIGEDHAVGVVGTRSLLEAAVRLLQHARECFLECCDGGGIELEHGFCRTAHEVLGQGHCEGGFTRQSASS